MQAATHKGFPRILIAPAGGTASALIRRNYRRRYVVGLLLCFHAVSSM